MPNAQLGYALNGAVVGLAVSQPDAGGLSQRCLGVGLVRAVDMAARRLYLLAPLSGQELEQVDTLLVGRAAADQLPGALLQAGGDGVVCPYRTLFALPGASGAAAGAAGMKGGRRNLGRAGLVDVL